MNKNLLLEIKGRSLELLAYAYEKRFMRRLHRDLVAFTAEAERKDLSSKQREIGYREIREKAFAESESGLVKAVAKDTISQLKLSQKHIEE